MIEQELEQADVLIRTDGPVGHLSLNRPKAIHSLTHEMCVDMAEALDAWSSDDLVKVIVIDHAEGRGFCAGGDINLLRQSVLGDGGAIAREFFRDEYRLNHVLFTYPKPVVTFMDGITMGGGVGISLPARYRVVTENTRFAMPETGIGLFPDVGGSFYLSRLGGGLGQFLGLTGARLDGAECLWAGLATHYLPNEALPEAKARIIAHPDRVAGILADLSATPPPPRIAGNVARIARHFTSDSYAAILASLAGDDDEWAAKERATLASKSPTSCLVALRQLALGADMSDFAEVMRMEYRLACRILAQPDFSEGVRALIVEKTNDPRWSPPRPEEVSEAEIAAIFAPLPAEQEWTPL